MQKHINGNEWLFRSCQVGQGEILSGLAGFWMMPGASAPGFLCPAFAGKGNAAAAHKNESRPAMSGLCRSQSTVP